MKAKEYTAIGYRQIECNEKIYDIVVECMVHEDKDSVSVGEKGCKYLLVYPIPDKQELKNIKEYIDSTFWLDSFKWNKKALN